MTRKQDNVLAEVKYRQLLPAPQMLHAIRKSAGVTQAAVAEVCGVDRASVSRWESGARRPSDSHLVAYMGLLEQLAAEIGWRGWGRPQGDGE